MQRMFSAYISHRDTHCWSLFNTVVRSLSFGATGMGKSDLGLSLDVWRCIFSYLSRSDLQQLMLVGPQLKNCVVPYLYQSVTFSEWAGSGLRLAVAIKQNKLSLASVSHIRDVSVVFTSFREILATLELLASIQSKLTGLNSITIRAHQSEDCFRAISLLAAEKLVDRIQIEATVSGPASQILAMADPDLVSRITSLKVPFLMRSVLGRLPLLEELTVSQIVQNSEAKLARVPRSLKLRFDDWEALESPPAAELDLELDLDPTKRYEITNPALKELRLVAVAHLPNIKVSLHAPCLRVLILCNIAYGVTISLLSEASSNLSLNQVEFLSLAPITIPTLQWVSANQLPSLRMVVALITTSSFLTGNSQKETSKIVQYLQAAARMYPLDVIDFTRKVKRKIYYSEGLWALASQGPYHKFLPFVAPPPFIQ